MDHGPLARMIVVSTLLWGAAAQADVVPPPATNCPVGSQGSTCHGGAYCAPKKCTDYASCPAGQTCQQVKFCIVSKNCTGGYGTVYADEVVASCEGGVPCAKGTCQSLVVCLPQATKDQGMIKDRPMADRPVTADRPKTADRPMVADQPTVADQPATVADRPTSGEQTGTPASSSGCNCRVDPAEASGLGLAGLFAVALMLCWSCRRTR